MTPYEHLSKLQGIVCLCGSTAYFEEWMEANRILTSMGNIVLSVGSFGHSYHKDAPPINTAAVKLLHYQKIKIADCIVWIHPNYLGASTSIELKWAKHLGKAVYGYMGDMNLPDTECFVIPSKEIAGTVIKNGLNTFVTSFIWKEFVETLPSEEIQVLKDYMAGLQDSNSVL